MPGIGPLVCSDSGFQGVNLGIAAGFSPFKPFCVQRFLISWGQLGNHCRENLKNGSGDAVILDFRPRFENHCRVPPAAGLATKIFRVRFYFSLRQRRMARLQWLWRQRVPHPIPIFVAAEKNGPPAAWSWDAGRDRMPRRRHNPK